MDLFFRIVTLVFFVLWQLYWIITERKADREKPKVPLRTKMSYLKRYGVQFLIYSFILLQVFGWSLFPVDFNSQALGFVFVLVGIAISISARKTLGTNWAHAAEYQIKSKQILITSGVYFYIRNPIYTGLVIAMTGAQLVAQSYLFILFALGGFVIAYKQAKLEEKILEKHFGREYTDYKKRSKMLIPFLW